MRVTIDDIVIGTITAVILTYAGECVGELMSETKLDAGIEVIRELATLNTVVRSLQFDGIVGSVHEMQTEEDSVITGNEHTTVSHIVLIAITIQ